MEAGVFALSRLRVRQQMRAGRRSAKLLHEHLENPERFLWTILVGNTLANLMILGWLVVLLNRTFPGQRVVFVAIFCPTVFLFYALFDLLPKMLFRMYPNRLCMSLARSFRFIHDVLRPLVGLVQWASSFLLAWRGGKTFTGKVFGNREELRSLMQESSQNLSSEERSMINRVLDLQSLTVRQVMTPMAQVVSIEQSATVASVLRLATERRLTRFPVWGTRNNQRRVIGIVDLNGISVSGAPVGGNSPNRGGDCRGLRGRRSTIGSRHAPTPARRSQARHRPGTRRPGNRDRELAGHVGYRFWGGVFVTRTSAHE